SDLLRLRPPLGAPPHHGLGPLSRLPLPPLQPAGRGRLRRRLPLAGLLLRGDAGGGAAPGPRLGDPGPGGHPPLRRAGLGGAGVAALPGGVGERDGGRSGRRRLTAAGTAPSGLPQRWISTVSRLPSSRSSQSSRWNGSIPARPGRRGTDTVTVCSPERMRCFRRWSGSPGPAPSPAGAKTPTSTHSSIGTSVSAPVLSAGALRVRTGSVTSLAPASPGPAGSRSVSRSQ